jgi:hypothetical protein
LPFVRFEDNESHCQRRHAFNLGVLDTFLKGGCGGVGPNVSHPFIIRNMRGWDAHWSFHTLAPSVHVDNFEMHHMEYGFRRQNYRKHAYRAVKMEDVKIKTTSIPTESGRRNPSFPNLLRPWTILRRSRSLRT